MHQVADWDDKSTNQGLGKAHCDVVVNRARHSGTEELLDWEWSVELDQGVESWV